MDVSSFAATLSQTYSDKILQLHDNTRPTRCCTTLHKCVLRQREPVFSVRLPASSTNASVITKGSDNPLGLDLHRAQEIVFTHQNMLPATITYCATSLMHLRDRRKTALWIVSWVRPFVHMSAGCAVPDILTKQSPESFQQQGSARTRTHVNPCRRMMPNAADASVFTTSDIAAPVLECSSSCSADRT